jgi:hypothetical protein
MFHRIFNTFRRRSSHPLLALVELLSSGLKGRALGNFGRAASKSGARKTVGEAISS